MVIAKLSFCHDHVHLWQMLCRLGKKQSILQEQIHKRNGQVYSPNLFKPRGRKMLCHYDIMRTGDQTAHGIRRNSRRF
jgi:hypothetical protein